MSVKNVSFTRAYREQAGLTQKDLGQKVGVTRQTIAAWEKGERSPSLAQMFKLAQALGIPPDLLLDTGDAAEESAALLFRADKPEALSRELRRLLSRRAEDYAEAEELAEEVPVLPEARRLNGYDSNIVERIASEVRDWLGVEDAPLGDVLAVLEHKGLKVIRHSLPSEVSGFSAYTDAWGGVIYVNSEHPTERQYFTALHELAHLIFHRQDYDAATLRPEDTKLREKAANHLAAAVLLPRIALEQELHSYHDRWLPDPLLVDIKQRYGVSVRTILMRAADLGLITKKQMGQQIGVINKRFSKTGEPGDLKLPETLGRYRRLVFDTLSREKITMSRAAEMLRVPLIDIRQELEAWLEPSEAAKEVAR